MTILSIQNVLHGYQAATLLRSGPYKPVLCDVSLTVAKGETLALLGRSGCGKSTLARLMMGLETPRKGNIQFAGKPVCGLNTADTRDFRRSVQMVFQDSISAVNPRKAIGDIIGEPLRHLTDLSARDRQNRMRELLAMVELDENTLTKRPPELSGGQLQRVCIARALAPGPRLVILDEAVSNLDLLLQIQVLALLRRLQEREGLSFLFITHDLRLVERFCSRVLVMADGKIVEECAVNEQLLFTHPASLALQNAILPAWPLGLVAPPSFNSGHKIDIGHPAHA
ncbi:nickel import ATP-binding protein NikE [Thalassospira marina]|uniref:Nickel import ATP-binding protein NikE n=1 Tax=Thalassospira marina TaxID=2048283 RepID=A0ABM6QGY8_9PROT|nr:nickel import ATP-binding protein NikE [Thalassospira marina]AUG55865.1 nickel import ATP-binding protein NikE [Thalassospira marina]